MVRCSSSYLYIDRSVSSQATKAFRAKPPFDSYPGDSHSIPPTKFSSQAVRAVKYLHGRPISSLMLAVY
jgi:hypothetical protein